ncbi:tyrosyl-DNA phosphodiesterase 1 [Sugiyamaella lignohabitans]|uniref:Tyrosyl-DNA phosphodiesterase 1 n=1 Tax=Sugiyamaella lignohabitans TaxID=796027 RepID=A0A167CK96_9ASCO|nr:tyrosyl-DNA phosphodiesterase 1 [Sugiyamaella lignohabitans]ANB11805.1 tyrosyl-DNA phosphodiesterase 1 [Sugiyamaella lignohabitans]
MKRSQESSGDETRQTQKTKTENKAEVRSSPIYLTTIEDLPSEENVDTVGLRDLIGLEDMVSMFQFNFMFTLPFILEKLHPRARSVVNSYFIYGRKPIGDDHTGDMLRAEREAFGSKQNITIDGETLMNAYATHHTKMMVLFFKTKDGEEEAQVVIHTANLIEFDWSNMTQGVWKSPRLKLKSRGESTNSDSSSVGIKFGNDFLKYLRKYRNKSAKLAAEMISKYDFSPVEAIFVASAPGNYNTNDPEYGQWGIVKLQKEIAKFSKSSENGTESRTGYVVAQVSSIATLGATDSYLGPIVTNALNGRPFFDKVTEKTSPLKLIFPSVEDVADSLEGYVSGSSIHFKRQSAPQLKQLEYMKLLLHRWHALKAGRQRCAPHIKTYTKVINNGQELEWLLLTSANLSKHAWGTVNKTKANHWIQSWECGVLIHANAFRGKNNSLVPVYKSNNSNVEGQKDKNTICVRMPYDLPLQKYTPRDVIWSANENYTEPDWRGNKWIL